MPLARRIIPCLDMKDGRVVKGEHFVNLKDAGDPVQLASLYRDQGADELVFLDITASTEKRDIRINLVKDAASVLDIPFTSASTPRSITPTRARSSGSPRFCGRRPSCRPGRRFRILC